MKRLGSILAAVCVLGVAMDARADNSLPGGPWRVQGSAPTLGTPALDLRYLKLDTSNDPLTDSLMLQKTVASILSLSLQTNVSAQSSIVQVGYGPSLGTFTKSVFLQNFGSGAVGSTYYSETNASAAVLNCDDCSKLLVGTDLSSSPVVLGAGSVEMIRMLNGTGITINAGLLPASDFAVGSDINPNAIAVDSSANCVGIFTAACSGVAALTVVGDASISVGLVTPLVFSPASAAGANLLLYSAANASGEVAAFVGSNANLAGATLNTTLLSVGYSSGAVPRFAVNGAGHIISTAVAAADAGTGTCTAVTVAGNDSRGFITATCTIAQNVVVTFGQAYTIAPKCLISPVNTQAVGGLAFASASTTELNLTAGAGGGAGAQWAYWCVE